MGKHAACVFASTEVGTRVFLLVMFDEDVYRNFIDALQGVRHIFFTFRNVCHWDSVMNSKVCTTYTTYEFANCNWLLVGESETAHQCSIGSRECHSWA